MYENNEFSNLTAHLKEMAEKKKEPKDKEEKPERPRSRKISDVAEFLMEQEKKKASRQETRTNVFMTFLITLLTTWRRPLRWTIQVVVYALILWGMYFSPLYIPLEHTNNTQTTNRYTRDAWHEMVGIQHGMANLTMYSTTRLTFEPLRVNEKKTPILNNHARLMYFVASIAVNISFFIMMMYPPYEAPIHELYSRIRRRQLDVL